MNTMYLCPSGISLLQNSGGVAAYATSASWDKLRRHVRSETDEALMRLSAEVNSLLKMGLVEGDRVVLLSSDTDIGERCADLTARELEARRKCDAKIVRVPGLQTDDKRTFDRKGIPNLTEEIIRQIEGYKHSYAIILNATAGFKAAVPYLTLIGMVFGLPIRYLFERSNDIIDLPPVPIELDLASLRVFDAVLPKAASDFLTREDFMREAGLSFTEYQEALTELFVEEDGFVTLRPVGRILYERYLRRKGSRVFISGAIGQKLADGRLNRAAVGAILDRMKDPIHVQSKLHNEVRKRGRVDLDCYKPGNTSERVFFFKDKDVVYVCEILPHDEYERVLAEGTLLRNRYDVSTFTEWLG